TRSFNSTRFHFASYWSRLDNNPFRFGHKPKPLLLIVNQELFTHSNFHHVFFSKKIGRYFVGCNNLRSRKGLSVGASSTHSSALDTMLAINQFTSGTNFCFVTSRASLVVTPLAGLHMLLA